MKPHSSSPKHSAIKWLVPLALTTMLIGCAPAHSDWKIEPGAVQHVYLNGVPHTDKNGRPMLKYDAARSFLPISIYHAVETQNSGITYRLADLKKAGFNCAFTYPGQGLDDLAKSATDCGLQMIFWKPTPADAKKYLNEPSVLGYCLDDEPIGHLGGDLEERFAFMEKQKKDIRAVDNFHPVFQVDAGWILPPATEWWTKLNTWGDISAHDNYPLDSRRLSLSHAQGIPETVAFAASINKESKPVWFVAQAHQWLDPVYQCTFPTITEQRCMTYTALIHGATGIVHFALDSYVTREGRVIGISPNPQARYSAGVVATRSELQQSRDLWDATVVLNAELNQLRPVLLSPTATVPYEVAIDDAYKPNTKDPIRTLLKTNPAGGYVLLLANIDAAPQNVKVRLPNQGYKLTELFNAPGAGYLVRKDDSFEFLAAPYDVRIFQIDLA